MAGHGHGRDHQHRLLNGAGGSPFGAKYTATKTAAEQHPELAAEYGPRGVPVNTLARGATLTPGNQIARGILNAITASTPGKQVTRSPGLRERVGVVADCR
jgi:NAD(P)-dependent dehydrogenase (short-subunit alcohol dehydrogenase family)